MLFYGVITFLCAVLCIPLRIYMELQCIDPFTGFYEGGTALRWLYVLLVGAAILCLLLPKRESRRNVKPVSGRCPLEYCWPSRLRPAPGVLWASFWFRYGTKQGPAC